MTRTVLLIACLVIICVGAFIAAHKSHGFDRRTPIVKAYEKTHKAVVNLSGEQTIPGSPKPGFALPNVFDLFGSKDKKKSDKRQPLILGSAVLVHENGYIVTNAHVVVDTQNIRASFSDGRDYGVSVISIDQSKDLAILKVEAKEKLPFVQLGKSNDLMIGETVIAIGNPFGYENTLSSGVVSAIDRDIQVREDLWLRGLIQTDAPINMGNSGGPLLNINGHLIGITTAIRAKAQNIGFAVPVDTLVDNLGQMLMPEKMRRLNLGLITGRMKTVGEFSGLEIESVTKESPAEKAGISAGDILVSIDQKNLSGVLDFYITVVDKQIDRPITVTFVSSQNETKAKTAKLTLASKPLPDGKQLAKRFFQMEVSELNKPIADKFGFEGAYQLLIVTETTKDGEADLIGLAPGDLILQINNQAPRDIKQLALIMEKIKDGDLVQIRIMRTSRGLFGQTQRQFIARLRATSKALI